MVFKRETVESKMISDEEPTRVPVELSANEIAALVKNRALELIAWCDSLGDKSEDNGEDLEIFAIGIEEAIGELQETCACRPRDC
jgi:hypothetical protein